MIAAWIKTAYVKIPVIVRHEQEVSFDEFTLPFQKTPRQKLVRTDVWLLSIESPGGMKSNFLIHTDHPVRVGSPMKRMQPFKIGMPLTQPGFPGVSSWNLYLIIFKYSQRQV